MVFLTLGVEVEVKVIISGCVLTSKGSGKLAWRYKELEFGRSVAFI